VPEVFSPAEQRRAEDLAGSDPRIRTALDTPDAGFTQVMAAGPELVRWWEQSPDKDCYGKAVITAALDARRVDTRTPATREFLQAAAPAYLTPKQRATAPEDWLHHALTYATTPLHGATATLCPVDAGMGHVAGYQTADYLHQHSRRVRRTIHLPDTAWQALVNHHHPDDTLRLAHSADQRGRDLEAETFYQTSADNGDADAAVQRAELLIEQGRGEEAITLLRPHTDNGNPVAAYRLADLLFRQGRNDELAADVAAGTPGAAEALRRARSQPSASTRRHEHDRQVTWSSTGAVIVSPGSPCVLPHRATGLHADVLAGDLVYRSPYPSRVSWPWTDPRAWNESSADRGPGAAEAALDGQPPDRRA
jgi:hypothetical protein